jgi:hypothetical protein
MTHFEHYRSGQVFGIRYRFDAKGDCIPRHAHIPSHAHNIVVLKGSIMLVMDATSSVCFPSVYDFDWTLPHEIQALENNSEVLHLFLNGQPQGYDSLPDNELRGTL